MSCTSHSYVVLESLQSWLKEQDNLMGIVDIVSPVGWIRLELLLEFRVSFAVLSSTMGSVGWYAKVISSSE